MRIALLSHEYPPETGDGGIGTYTRTHARALVKLGHEVHVLAGSPAGTAPNPSVVDDGVRVWRFRGSGPARTAYRAISRLGLGWSSRRIENALTMRRGLSTLRGLPAFDIIESPECGAEGLLVNRFTAATTVVRFHSPARILMPGYPGTSWLDRAICSWLEQASINGAKWLSAPSQFMANAARDELGVDRTIQVIPNGVDLDAVDPPGDFDIRQTLGLPRDRTVILFAGRLEPRKGSHLLPEIAAAILAKYPVSFVLAGEDSTQFMSHHRLAGPVHYLGKLAPPAVRAALRQSDVVLIPSLWENCPYACLEAMAAGRAIVSSDAGGLPELIQHDVNGLLAASGKPQAFVSQIQRVLDEPSLGHKLGAAARATVELSHSDVGIARRTVEWYEACLR